MGLKDAWSALRGKAAIPNPDTPSIAGLTSATVTQVEDQVAKYRDFAGYKELAPLVKGLALDLAMFNAKCLASVPLRLWMPERAALKHGIRHAKPNLRTKRHIMDSSRVGSKAVIRAQQAGEVVEVLDHPVLDVLRRPSPETTGMSWDLLRWVNKQLYGDAILLVIQGTGSPVIALPHLRPNWTHVQPDKERGISGWYYGRDQNDLQKYDAEEVICMPWADHPHRLYRGLGWLELAERELEIEDFALASELSRWRNGGYPEGLLSFKNVKDQKQLDAAVDAFYKQLIRSRKRGGVVATSESVYTPLSIAEEMNYIPGMELVERRVMNRAGVPEALYKLNDANLASSYSADPSYAKRTIMPALTVDAEQWTELLLPRFGIDPDSMWFAYDTVGDTDLAALRQDAVYVQQGIRTINEHRALLGDDPVNDPLADKLLVNGVPLSRSGSLFGGSPSPATPAIVGPARPSTVGDDADSSEAAAATGDVAQTALNGAQVAALQGLASEVAQGLLPADTARAIAEAAFPLISPAILSRIFGKLDAFTPEPEPEGEAAQPADDEPPTVTRARTPLLGRKAWTPDDPYVCQDGCDCCGGIETKDDDRLDIERERLAKIEAAVRSWMLAAAGRVASGALDISELDAALAADLEPLVADLFREGASGGYAQLGIEDSDIFEVVPQQALDAVRARNSLIIEQIRGTTEDAIREAIDRAVGEGMSATEARNAVAEEMETSADWRAERIARTEAAEAHVAGSQAAWLQAGIEANSMLLAPDACSICQAVFAKINDRPDAVGKSSGLTSKAVPITEPIVKAGETIVGLDGKKMTFRRDVYRTPIHPNDRCAMTAYIPDDEE